MPASTGSALMPNRIGVVPPPCLTDLTVGPWLMRRSTFRRTSSSVTATPALRRPVAPPGLEGVALALDMAELTQALAKAVLVHRGPGRRAAHPSDAGRLLGRLRAGAGAGGEEANRKAGSERAPRDPVTHAHSLSYLD
jgi:hypothetical protein